MAASMVRSRIAFSLPRHFLPEVRWKEQGLNNMLQVPCLLQMQCHGYRITPSLLKQRDHVKTKKAKLEVREKFIKGETNIILPHKPTKSIIEVWDNMRVDEIAVCLNKKISDVLDFLRLTRKTERFSVDTVLPRSIITAIAKGCNKSVMFIAKPTEKKDPTYMNIIKRPPPDESRLVRRPPVVTIMGHIDHGKTTLLDALRNSSIVKSEFGGITQHIGAFNVTLKSGERVTFLDTPGHAAFASMRYRGALITDIVVLVVAADDGVQDQTLQSIEMAQSAKVPIIVAINKIDKHNANIETTEKQLAEKGVITESLGGDVQCIKISALKGMNLELLTEAIAVQAEIMDLKADPTGLVEGVVIECTQDIYRGKLVTALIKRGTLKKGSYLVAGMGWAKVRSMFNDTGNIVTEAKPSDAVQIIGWRASPKVGDEILEMENEKSLNIVLKHNEHEHNEALAQEHKKAADEKLQKHLKEYKDLLLVKRTFVGDRAVQRQVRAMALATFLENQKNEKKTSDFPMLNVVIKGDVAGSIEAILDVFDTYTEDNKCRLNVVHYGVGPVVETDVHLAETFNAIIYAFNVNTTKQVEAEINKKGMSLRCFNVVYKLFDDIKEEINSRLPTIEVRDVLGEAIVQQQFTITEKNKKVNVAGCRCVKGTLLKDARFTVIRRNETIYEGNVVSMRHVKNEVSSIKSETECGIRFEDPKILFQPGDVIVCYKMVPQVQKIEWNLGF